MKVITADEQARVEWVESADHPGFGRRYIVAHDGRRAPSEDLMRLESARRTAEAKGLPLGVRRSDDESKRDPYDAAHGLDR